MSRKLNIISLAVQWLRLHASMVKVGFHPHPHWELRSHMLDTVAKKRGGKNKVLTHWSTLTPMTIDVD